ncbi:SMODS-associated NUDIX domain-containing protein [Flavobacterium caseinilyticum]|uniref:CD-NTase-associated protein 16 NUDIX domain-containing protein n=1 Tax=Flavobacterium caseinilyticum TaxID=2541732 RepID=A0A4R5B2Y3_9FLAO|nr:hypothetical protein [Flavobacterium caseinilyticum]TDD78546.1 hypothetical protein E0F89_02620 [Flavobacterium caseinilyticum]
MSNRGKISFSFGILGLVSSFFLKKSEIQDAIFNISLGFIVACLMELVIFLLDNKERWKLIKPQFWKYNLPVRVTVAYLFRIEFNGKYMLIKRHKNDFVGYQPIGGAYKYFKEENREIFDNLGIVPCNHVPRDEDTENDLRIVINKRKKLSAFFKWFENRKNREIDPWREFYEELIEPGFLPEKLFKHIKYAYVGKHEEGVLRTEDYPIEQFRYADIFELRLETDAQKEAIKSLVNNDNIAFVTAEEIRKGHTNGGIRILPHTFKILPK